MPNHHRSAAHRSLLALAAAIPLALAACAHYANYPPIGNDLAVNDPNTAPLPELIAAALRDTVRRYPVDGAFVINLPAGLERRRAESIAAELGENARLVVPGTQHLPAYHVTRIWVRGDRATVEVLRPVTELHSDSATPDRHQAISIRLARGAFAPWSVTSHRAWTIGAGEPPELFGWPEDWPEDQAPR